MSVRLSVVRIACPSMEWMSGCDSCAQKLRRFTGSGDMSGVSSLDFFGVRGVSATETSHLKDPGGGGWHKASVSDCLPLAAPIGLSPLPILTLCGSKRVLVVSTEPLDDLSCLTTPGVGRPADGLLPVPLTRGIQMHTPSPCGGLPTPALT